MVPLTAWFLKSTRAGLILRAVGENDLSAHSIGYSVRKVRYAAIAFGGAMAGIGGAYFCMVITPMWAEKMTAGRGWIALALVVFAGWRMGRLLAGAYFFGILMALELYAKASGFCILAVAILGRYALSHDRHRLDLHLCPRDGGQQCAGLSGQAFPTFNIRKPTGELNDQTSIVAA